MSDKEIHSLDGNLIRASNFGNCQSKNCIYLAVCNICEDFYIGQTQNELRKRINGHRDKFKLGKCTCTRKDDKCECETDIFMKSSLAQHIYKDHPDFITGKVDNFNFTVLYTSEVGFRLNEYENNLINKTRADIVHLNRYKVLR